MPHILRFALAATTGVPESKIRVIAPDVGGGFGGKLQVTPEEWIAWCARAPARQAGQVHRDPFRVADGGPPRSRPVAEDHLGGREGRHRDRAQGRAPGRPRCLRRRRRRRCAGAGRLHVQRDLQVPGVPLRLPDGADQQGLDRRLPRGRPSRGHLRHRADHGRARQRARRRPVRRPREELDHARGVPVHHGGGPGVRLRQLREGHGGRQGELRLRRAPRRAEAAARVQRPGPARHRGLDLHRDVRTGPLPGARLAGLRGRRLGARERADAGHRHGRDRHRCQRPRPGPRDGVQPDRRRPARGAVRCRRGAARRHPGRSQGARHLRLALAGRRW